MAKVLNKKYRTFIDSNGNWTDPLFDYQRSTTYHHDDNAEEFDTISDSVTSVMAESKYDIPDLPNTGFIEQDLLYKWIGLVVRCRQSHKRTIYDPTVTPALFSVYRIEADDMEWIEGEQVSVGIIRTYDGIKYECIQAHQTQSDWTPDKTPTLWKVYEEPVNEISEWVQPTGAHDAYNIGDQVLFNDDTYESVINANVWSPAVYPAGWNKL